MPCLDVDVYKINNFTKTQPIYRISDRTTRDQAGSNLLHMVKAAGLPEKPPDHGKGKQCQSPTNSLPTSIIGNQVKPLASRLTIGVNFQDRKAMNTSATSRAMFCSSQWTW